MDTVIVVLIVAVAAAWAGRRLVRAVRAHRAAAAGKPQPGVSTGCGCASSGGCSVASNCHARATARPVGFTTAGIPELEKDDERAEPDA